MYSESPIAEDDKLKIRSLLSEEPTLEGGTSALSIQACVPVPNMHKRLLRAPH
ncbi:hypothetical protein [Legionella tucsonensis]|uniref:Uncharacterized protein n=1 Tax=Legionella tucsonensis TaxID=40335 RepID=A0A0W0ZZ55_9GAMM|nr:hypothetical protein [Legionella tucsonensis]KTD74376.1 hypothetical protein Ltuc_2223 [Legionella tucsonensis]